MLRASARGGLTSAIPASIAGGVERRVEPPHATALNAPVPARPGRWANSTYCATPHAPSTSSWCPNIVAGSPLRDDVIDRRSDLVALRQRLLRGVVAGSLLALATAVGIAIAVATSSSAGDPGTVARIDVDQIEEGVHATNVLDRAAIIARDGDEIAVFFPLSPHFDGSRHIDWCDEAGVFVEWEGGSIWTRGGKKLSGPTPRSLDRYPSHVDGDVLVVDLSTIEYRDVFDREVDAPPGFDGGRSNVLVGQPATDYLYTDAWARSFAAAPKWCPDPDRLS